MLHVLANFGEILNFMWHPHLKIIFLFLMLCVNSLQADQVIREAQTKLTALGYYKARVDGSHGSITSAAIRRFQFAKKLKITGALNQQTLDALGIKTPPPAPDYSKINTLFDGGPLSGMDSAAQVEAIRHAQRLLAESGIYAGPQNGLPSATLTASINEWQYTQGLPQTGKLDVRTLAGLGIVRN
jgi:peptidoglycan hydrolase-like protein with peptidoglycan-binding domain